MYVLSVCFCLSPTCAHPHSLQFCQFLACMSLGELLNLSELSCVPVGLSQEQWFSSGAQFCPPGHLVMSRDIFGLTTGWLEGGGGWRPPGIYWVEAGVLVNTLRCPQQPLQQRITQHQMSVTPRLRSLALEVVVRVKCFINCVELCEYSLTIDASRVVANSDLISR